MCTAGEVPGLCRSTNLTIGHTYVILVSTQDNGQYRPTDGEFHASDQKLAELASVCGLQHVYPWGMYDSKKLSYRRETGYEQTTAMSPYSRSLDSENGMIVALVVLTQYQCVTDRQAERWNLSLQSALHNKL